MNPIQQAIEALLTGAAMCAEGTSMRKEIEEAITSLRSLQKEVEGVEPVGEVRSKKSGEPGTFVQWYATLPAGTKLYTADQLRTAVAAALGRGAVRQGWKLVPEEPTPEMRKAAADAWLDCDSKLFLNKAGVAVRAAIAISKESA